MKFLITTIMVEDLREIALKAYNAIFSNSESIHINGEKVGIKYTSIQGLRKFEVNGYDFIEQNPEKDSSWAKKAREGHKILWVMNHGEYIAQVRDGEFHDFRKE